MAKYVEDLLLGTGLLHDHTPEYDARYLLESNNLSDLTNVSTARTNLGLGDLAVLDNITASLVTDFDTEVSNNTDVVANTSARHDAVTLGTNTASALSLSGQELSLGDVFVQTAGDTMTGDLTLDNSNDIVLGNTTTKAGQITMFANTTGSTATINAGPVYAVAGENGIQIERLLLTAGRFDFDPDGGKAEMRVDGAATIFNIFNKGSFVTMFTANSTGVLLGGNGSQTPDEKLSIIGNFNVKDADTATKQYRFRTSGGSLDFEGAGAGLVFSVWTGAGFTGTQYNYFHARDVGAIECFSEWQWKGGLFQGTRHFISGDVEPVVFNEGAEDIDFRVETDSAYNAIFVDAGNDAINIMSSASGLVGFFGTTAVAQQTTGVSEATFVENSGGTAVNDDSTFGGYTMGQVVQALQNYGILA